MHRLRARPFKGWQDGARLRFPVPEKPIPICIGGQGPKVMEMMVELGDGGLPIVFPPETIDQAVERIKTGADRIWSRH